MSPSLPPLKPTLVCQPAGWQTHQLTNLQTSEQLERLKERNRYLRPTTNSTNGPPSSSASSSSTTTTSSTTTSRPHSATGKPIVLPGCCSYDQVYERIIELLNSTMLATYEQTESRDGKPTNSSSSSSSSGQIKAAVSPMGRSFGRALMDELEVSISISFCSPCLKLAPIAGTSLHLLARFNLVTLRE